ncbi:MAG TPA: NYN domain-containing protein [Pseudohongiella sp.]|nr:NYN domain-containing protein [Pseudohongiella sp.]
MVRVVSYIDGFNLYFGLKSKGWKRYYWLDLSALSESLLIPGQELQSTHYFTSRLTPTSVNWADKQRQDTYLDALQARNNVFIHYGHYLKKTRECRQCKANWPDYEEKMTDVNIAVQLLADAYDDKFDTAIIISADSDLVTPA